MKYLIAALLLFIITFNSNAQVKKVKLKTSANATYLIGTWKLMQAPSGDGMGMSQTWMFTKTGFTVEGYPELKQKGMYKVMKETGDTLILKLYKQNGHWGTADKEQKIVIVKEKNQISMGWLQFRRKE
ncbi:MAG TPA: hypothetical protein VGF30_04195 [Bacteroidia bacterium]